MTGFVFLINCVAAITIHSKYGTHDGVSTAFEGDCDTTNRWSLGIHIIINILSSLLLSASNYTMQVLNAPTRLECDKAHARGGWMDIGITSLHNIFRVTWPRRVLWLLLGVSSVPIHLLYNSAAFKTIDSNAYSIILATPLYLQSDAVHYSDGTVDYRAGVLRQTYESQKSEFVNLTAAECVKTYGVDFVSGYTDVIAMISGPYPANASIATIDVSSPKLEMSGPDSYKWYVYPARGMIL
jgi:hypothetical protein